MDHLEDDRLLYVVLRFYIHVRELECNLEEMGLPTALAPPFVRRKSSPSRSVGVMNSGISDPEIRKKKLNAELLGWHWPLNKRNFWEPFNWLWYLQCADVGSLFGWVKW